MSDDTPIPELPVSKPPIRFRRLRIAVSVFFGLLTVALVVLWVRSYSAWDCIYGSLPNNHRFSFSTVRGRVRFATFEDAYTNTFSGRRRTGWGASSTTLRDYQLQNLMGTSPLRDFGLGIAGSLDRYGVVVILPLYALVVIFVVLAYIPWMLVSLRFSLRTMLIVTTLVAVVLGLVVWMLR